MLLPTPHCLPSGFPALTKRGLSCAHSCYNSLSNGARRMAGRGSGSGSSRDGAVQDRPITRWPDSCVLQYGRQQLAAAAAGGGEAAKL